MEYNKHPYRKIPKELMARYTMGGKIPIDDYWCGSGRGGETKWSKELVDEYVKRFTVVNIKENREGKSPYGHDSVARILQACEEYDIKNKKVAVVGSESPWIEAILLNLGNKVTTIEYNDRSIEYENLTCENYFEYFEKTEDQFDAIVTFSSVEHSGLGRYGDPLDPDGDIKTMKAIHRRLKDDGVLVWGAPVGLDMICWNAHRVYGEKRLPILFEGFKEEKWFGNQKKEKLLKDKRETQPVIVLTKY